MRSKTARESLTAFPAAFDLREPARGIPGYVQRGPVRVVTASA